MGSDTKFRTSDPLIVDFNPRSPCGERPPSSVSQYISQNFNPRSPCGERRDQMHPPLTSAYHFNPRSPCGERLFKNYSAQVLKAFQSTLPVWGATRVGSSSWVALQFQSTLPVWGATNAPNKANPRLRFQSTLPVWGATKELQEAEISTVISIHAPRVGSDIQEDGSELEVLDFNPRSPCGERPPSWSR